MPLGRKDETKAPTKERRWSLLAARLPAPPAGNCPEPVDFEGVRLTTDEADATLRRVADRLAPERPLLAREEFNILALSGGAAGGAFGAGVLVGLTKAGRRPSFAIVTGVSTGALIAPFAFLGSAWDDKLIDGYLGGRAAKLLSPTRLGPLFSSGVFNGANLESLVEPFVNEEMIEAIAVEHRKGRRLLVATTNLDSQRTSVWDMGAIACVGGPAALKLFRDVLVASATLPGLFPPKLIDVECNGERFQEMHVDGGVSTPLFVMPDALLHWKELGRRLRNSRVYVIVNTTLDQAHRTTQPNAPAILARSFDTMLRFSYRQALSLVASFCATNRLPLSVAAMPPSAEGFMMRFDTASLRQIFDAAVEQASGDRLWATPVPGPLTLDVALTWIKDARRQASARVAALGEK